MSHAYSPRRAAIYRDAESARRERTATRREQRKLKRIETGAVAVAASRKSA